MRIKSSKPSHIISASLQLLTKLQDTYACMIVRIDGKSKTRVASRLNFADFYG